ncbi:MAG: GNAT family N-acetyltransferase [Candidatus Eremiobacteraeota bacterium]|nr:GNAT family N-acetyltransferase [Candidatus Eremiobacteraeota bacterium]
MEKHADIVYAALNDDEMWRFFPALRPANLKALRERYQRFARGYPHSDGKELWENWIVFLKRNGEPIGATQATIGPATQAYIAYGIHRAHWRKGYAAEAARAVIDHLQLEHGIRTVFAEMNTKNYASVGLIESLGFRRVQMRERVDSGNGLIGDEYLYELTLTPPFETPGLPGIARRP